MIVCIFLASVAGFILASWMNDSLHSKIEEMEKHNDRKHRALEKKIDSILSAVEPQDVALKGAGEPDPESLRATDTPDRFVHAGHTRRKEMTLCGVLIGDGALTSMMGLQIDCPQCKAIIAEMAALAEEGGFVERRANG